MTAMERERSWTHDDRAESHSLTTPGPWDGEPDKIQWIDGRTDLDCLMVRNHMGNWCGYVGVPPGHPAHGKDYGSLEVDVHGGLTFASSCDEDADEGHGICHVPFPGREPDVWWLGFDCGHGFDLIPGFAKYAEEHAVLREGKYRDLAYVRREVQKLALQLHGMA